jgi:hypothetical protein
MKKEVYFEMNGQGLTNLIRQTWAEGRLSIALSLCEDSGAPAESHIDICTGKQKIAGVGDLHLEPDNITSWCGHDITLEASVNRLEEKYVKLHTQFANADLRMRYFTLRCDWAGIKYRNPKMELYPEFTYDKDQVTINRVGKELAELEPLFSVLYPLVGKTMSDVPYDRFTEEEIFEPDLDHPYYLPNLKKNKNEVYKQEDPDGPKTITGGIPVFPKKAIETEAYKDLTEKGELPEITNHLEKEIEPIFPWGIDDTYVENAWISPDGEFYGDARLSIGSVYVHIEMADRLLENNIIPKSETKSPEEYMEYVGWIKLSRNEVLFHPKDGIDYTSSQIKTLKRYAKVRGLDEITIGAFGNKVKVKNLDSLTYWK